MLFWEGLPACSVSLSLMAAKNDEFLGLCSGHDVNCKAELSPRQGAAGEILNRADTSAHLSRN
jgi:hypothetical protein